MLHNCSHELRGGNQSPDLGNILVSDKKVFVYMGKVWKLLYKLGVQGMSQACNTAIANA